MLLGVASDCMICLKFYGVCFNQVTIIIHLVYLVQDGKEVYRLHDKKQKYASVREHKGFSIAEQNKMMLSAETRLDFSLHVLQYYNYKTSTV